MERVNQLSAEESRALNEVAKTTPMGAYLRRFWHPVCRAGALAADGAPRRIRLLGEDFVAFRATSGRVAVLSERCPHRGASLALAHNASEGLRCIFHGWKIGVDGKVAHVPTEPPGCAASFAERIAPRNFPAREAGGLVWTYIGPGEPPAFPDFEFADLPGNHIDVRLGVFRCGWLQGLEAVIDPTHVTQLHRSSFQETFVIGADTQENSVRHARRNQVTALRFEIAETPYGFRETSYRDYPDGAVQANYKEIVAPYFTFLTGAASPDADRVVCMSVPMDEGAALQIFVTFNVKRPLDPAALARRWRYAHPDPDDFVGPVASAAERWGQNREAMAAGHSSGFPVRHSFYEDFIVQESIGATPDRTLDHLGSSDSVVAFARRRLLQAARDLASGALTVWGQETADAPRYRSIRAFNVFFEPGAYPARENAARQRQAV